MFRPWKTETSLLHTRPVTTASSLVSSDTLVVQNQLKLLDIPFCLLGIGMIYVRRTRARLAEILEGVRAEKRYEIYEMHLLLANFLLMHHDQQRPHYVTS